MSISPIQKQCIVTTWRKNTLEVNLYLCPVPHTEANLLSYLTLKEEKNICQAMCYFSLTKRPFIKFKIGIPSRTQPDLMRLSQPSLGELCKCYPLSGLGLVVVLLLFISPIQLLILFHKSCMLFLFQVRIASFFNKTPIDHDHYNFCHQHYSHFFSSHLETQFSPRI